MNYLILGGAGFIGTHLSKQLISEGHEVVIVDNCMTSSSPTYQVKFYNKDIISFDQLEQLIVNSDIVYFLAGSVGVKHVVENPSVTLMNNIGLAVHVTPLVAKHNKLLMFASTSEVYGNGPFSEDNSLSIGPPTNLRWGYASAKLTTEFIVASSGTAYRIFRFFNITGPGQLGEYGMVLPRFVASAVKNDDIVVYGDGTQYRSFCHITDAVAMIRQLELAPNGIYNIGNDDPITILDLAKRVKQVLNSNSSIICKPLHHVYSKHSGDIHKRIPDLTKIKNTVDYKITKTLEDIIKEIANDQ
jgi:UDP-glucose 4-epimerase